MMYTFHATPWLYPGEAAWTFVSVPRTTSDEIKSLHGTKKAFGSIPLQAHIGTLEWQTSLFFDSKSGVYLLPLKKEVRQKASIRVGQEITISLSFT